MSAPDEDYSEPLGSDNIAGDDSELGINFFFSSLPDDELGFDLNALPSAQSSHQPTSDPWSPLTASTFDPIADIFFGASEYGLSLSPQGMSSEEVYDIHTPLVSRFTTYGPNL